MTRPRGMPYFWVTWLTSLLAGESSCEYAPWFRGHYQDYLKVDRGADFDLSTWKAEHAELVETRACELRGDGWAVSVEDQNKFTLKGSAALVGGKPDIVASRDHEMLVVDSKGGKRRGEHIQQVEMYMFALPFYHPSFKQTPPPTLAGEVHYRQGGPVRIAPEAFTDAMRSRIAATIKRLASWTAPAPTASPRECALCDISKADCPYRIESAEAVAEVGGLF